MIFTLRNVLLFLLFTPTGLDSLSDVCSFHPRFSVQFFFLFNSWLHFYLKQEDGAGTVLPCPKIRAPTPCGRPHFKVSKCGYKHKTAPISFISLLCYPHQELKLTSVMWHFRNRNKGVFLALIRVRPRLQVNRSEFAFLSPLEDCFYTNCWSFCPTWIYQLEFLAIS